MAEENKILQDDDNFLVELVERRGNPAVKKTVKQTAPKSRAERICNDVYGMRFFADLAHENPDFGLKVPKIYESHESYYVREYVDESPVNSEAMVADEAVPRLDKLAQLLAQIDRLEPYGEVRFVGSSNWQNLHKSIARWADENVQDGLITHRQVKSIMKITQDLGQFIRPRIAHGDMSPYKHAYLDSGGQISFIDFENFTPQAARYFDVAWTYTRLWSFALSTDIPRQFLASFIAKAEPVKNQREQLMAVLIQRTLGMQKDADADLKSKGVDFRDRAKELLELVLKNKLELLHS